MNENAKKWVAALRSGKYKQGKRQLRAGDAFCCLGVACDLFDPASWNGCSYRYLRLALPNEVRDWLGLIETDPYYGKTGRLSYDNDEGKTFAEIADIIEAHQYELFVKEAA